MVTPARRAPLTKDLVLQALQDVKDPEIPVVSIVDLGIVQGVVLAGGRVTVSITPTFTGCPAIEHMRREIVERLIELGADAVEVPIVLDPPWSTDRITPAARQAMEQIGIAPPHSGFTADESLSLTIAVESVPCPWCGHRNTSLESAFGPTICRSIHYCHTCRQSFEQFKALGPLHHA